MLEFTNLADFARYVGGPAPLSADLDVQLLAGDDLAAGFDLPPFRHRFYSVSFYEAQGGDLRVGPWPLTAGQPLLFFKTPYQVHSWQKEPGRLRLLCVYFTEEFLVRHRHLDALVFDFPFLQFDKALPFVVQAADKNLLVDTYQKIAAEYHGGHPDRFDLIAAYLRTLLLQVRRLYGRYAAAHPELAAQGTRHDAAVVAAFKALLEQTVAAPEPPAGSRSVAYYAGQLHLHPNHLTTISKRTTGQTAQELIHDQVLRVAKALLLHTTLSAKEIAFQLGFQEPAHFGNYFKKYARLTPTQFRARLLVPVAGAVATQ